MKTQQLLAALSLLAVAGASVAGNNSGAAEPAQTQGKTRAEVRAEIEQAWRTGELPHKQFVEFEPAPSVRAPEEAAQVKKNLRKDEGAAAKPGAAQGR